MKLQIKSIMYDLGLPYCNIHITNIHMTNEDEEDAGDGEGDGCDVKLPQSPTE